MAHKVRVRLGVLGQQVFSGRGRWPAGGVIVVVAAVGQTRDAGIKGRLKEKGNRVPFAVARVVDDAVHGTAVLAVGPAFEHVSEVDHQVVGPWWNGDPLVLAAAAAAPVQDFEPRLWYRSVER